MEMGSIRSISSMSFSGGNESRKRVSDGWNAKGSGPVVSDQ